MDNVIEFRRSHNALVTDAAKADVALLGIDDAERERGLDVHSSIDFRAKDWNAISDRDLAAASTVAKSLAQSTRIEAERAGEPSPALAEVIAAAVADENPSAIRDLARRAERRMADVGLDDLTSRERRIVVAAWARREDEARREMVRRNGSEATV